MRMSIILIFSTDAYHKLMNVLKSQYELICKDHDMTVAAWSCCKSGALQTMQSLLSLWQLACASLACPSHNTKIIKSGARFRDILQDFILHEGM